MHTRSVKLLFCCHYYLLGESPTDPVAEQVGLTTVQVSWTAPSVPPSNGYRITTNPGSASANALASPHTITISTPGVYTIQVMSLSQLYAWWDGGTRGDHCERWGQYHDSILNDWVCYLGVLAPTLTVSSLTATSVTVSWTQPPFSFTPVNYIVTLTGVMGGGQELCPTFEDDRSPIQKTATSHDFISLEEFSTYRITITARFMDFGLSLTTPSSMEFMTLSAGSYIFRSEYNSYKESKFRILCM